MPQDDTVDTIEAKLHLSIENKQLVLQYFPSASMHVASLETVHDEKDNQFVLLKL